MTKLFCAVPGLGRVIGVDIDLSEGVPDLKLKIKQSAPKLIHFDEWMLNLYLAKDDSAWLKSSGDDMKALSDETIPDRLQQLMVKDKRLRNTWKLDDDRCMGKVFEQRNGDIPVLVQLPTSPTMSEKLQKLIDSIVDDLHASVSCLCSDIRALFTVDQHSSR